VTTPYVDPQTIHNPAPSTVPPAAWGDAVRDGLEFAVRMPGCIVSRTANQSIPNDTGTNVLFTAADTRDTDAYHDNVTNADQIVIPTGLGGLYHVHAQIDFASGSTGRRQASITVNNVGRIVGRYAPHTNAVATNVHIGGQLIVAAGDVIRLNIAHTQGSALNCTATMWVQFVALS
jgi:hypothetical protein